MATYTDRMKGVKEVTYEEAFQNVKDDLRYQLIWVYFKDEPEFVKIIEDDDAYEKIFAEVLDSEGFRESYAVHCRRRYVVRFVGVLYEFGETFPPRIGNRVALELGVKYIAYHLKRSPEYELTNLQRLKFYNKALKMEMIMLREDLEWNDDLNDDMFNEIQRFERNVEREREENERLLLKGKARKAEIELLNYRLLKEFGIEQQREARQKKAKKPLPKPKQKLASKDDEEYYEKINSVKTSHQRGFTSIVKE